MPVRFMSFNIRTSRALDPATAWRRRREAAIDTIRSGSADVVGLQEALRRQLGDISFALPRYFAIGRGRLRRGWGEHVALLIDRDRFELERWGDFWLSESPHRPASIGWDAALPRMCTFAVLRDGDARFAVFNTHFDHRGRRAMEESARLVVVHLRELEDTPAVVMGDLNATEETDPIRTLRQAGLRDTYRERQPHADEGSFHGFGRLQLGPRIDYILCDNSWDVLDARIECPDGATLPSDHYPVTAVLELR